MLPFYLKAQGRGCGRVRAAWHISRCHREAAIFILVWRASRPAETDALMFTLFQKLKDKDMQSAGMCFLLPVFEQLDTALK